jgi:cyclase
MIRNVVALSVAAISILTAVPAMAQIDLAGEWAPQYHEDQPERLPGPELGDYLGLPITAAARERADTWDASVQTLTEWQCRPHPSDYGSRGPGNLRIWADIDPATQDIVAWHTHIIWQAQERTIWMDNRPHPSPNAAHTWQGFSTGHWDGDMLTVTTTHLKEAYIRRNGTPRSDLATLTEHWIRHGNYLTLVSIVSDPVYLTEPFIRTTNWVLDLSQRLPPYPCDPEDEIVRPEGVVPNHLPGTNPFLNEFAQRNHLPEQAARGGAATAYPEYRLTIHGNSSAAVPLGRPMTVPSVVAMAGPKPGALDIIHVHGNVYMLNGGGGNITLQFGKDGALLVDAGAATKSTEVLAALHQLTDRPLRYILDTTADADHTGGNGAVGKIGQTIIGGDEANFTSGLSDGAKIYAYETVLGRLAAGPGADLPTDAYVRSEKDLYFNDEAVQLLHQPAAHSDGDTIVFFRKSDVLSTGDVFVTDGYPTIDLAHGGSIQGEIAALNRILELTVPADKEEGGTMVVPGHGRLCDEADVAYYRDMVTIIRDRIQDLVNKGMTLEQVKAARPTADYDPRWGTDTGNRDRFIEAVYAGVAKKAR